MSLSMYFVGQVMPPKSVVYTVALNVSVFVIVFVFVFLLVTSCLLIKFSLPQTCDVKVS